MKIEPTRLFEQQVKRLTKKYPSLAQEIPTALTPLANNQLEGFDAMPKGFYKIRVPIASKGVGKRGGARIIAHVRIVEDKAFLVSIYDKAEYSNVSDDALKEFTRDYKPPQ
jgi:hypothetical protein